MRTLLITAVLAFPWALWAQQLASPPPSCETQLKAVVADWQQCTNLKVQNRVDCENDKTLIQLQLAEKDKKIGELEAQLKAKDLPNN